jgi:hypothetical protein
LAGSLSQHKVAFSLAVQAEPAQYVDEAALIFFMPAEHATPASSHLCLVMQHSPSVLPVSPNLAGSLILLVLQVYVAPLHLVVTSTQQAALSATPHELVAQYVDAAAVI